MPLLEPVFVASLADLIWDRFKPTITELVANERQFLIPFDMIELEAFVDLSVTNWTHVWRVCIGLFEMVYTLHEALIPCTVTHSKHMAKLMGHKFDDSLQSPTVLVFLAFKFLFSPIGSEASNTLDTSICWNAISVAEITEILRKKVNISERDNSDATWFGVLNRGTNFLQYMDCVVLGLIFTVFLSINAFSIQSSV